MTRVISCNTQGRDINEIGLLELDIKSADLILLQRCNRNLQTELLLNRDDRGLNWNGNDWNSIWSPQIQDTNERGLCVFSRKDLTLDLHRINVDFDSTDSRNQSNAYQYFTYNGLRWVNFLPPYEPENVEYDYIDQLLCTEFDVAVGDCHNDYQDSTRHPSKFHSYRVANSKPNYKQDKQLSWVFVRNETLERDRQQFTLAVTNERVIDSSTGHSAFEFTVERINLED